jgi:hypothetical protein
MTDLTTAKAAWLELTADGRANFVAFQASEGLTTALFDANYLVEGKGDISVIEDGTTRRGNATGCFDFYTVPPSDDPYRPTAALELKLCDDHGCDDAPTETVDGVDGEFCNQCARYIREDAHEELRQWRQEQQAEYDNMYPALEEPWWTHT